MIAYSSVAATGYESQDDLVTRHVALVKRIAHHLAARLPSTIEIDDLLQSGMIGLLEAAGKFDASRGASFETYAGIRIRGAMLDDVRKQDWTPRSVHQKHRKVSETVRAIEAETGRLADGQEVAARLGVSVDEYHDILRDTAQCRLFSLEETLEEPGYGRDLPASDTATPDQELDQSQFRSALAQAVDRLPEREKLVLSLYYEQELNLKEIGAVLGVSESRVCQIHGQALIHLRAIVDT
ncbi:MAG: RNA polymerase sigma factor FliA [Gammaproteobacteria bacterium]|nr:RNA polymerase sigma factor FliA [Gammaproteobacteria bacterium]MDH4313275.1 RNA polymerase sigma factor FliA [Gammaproteobacteria bacterium]MDH5212924.1 RNA polymerase sigma factor FliA [Gammaproteobacteria bacterium]MDH5499469.1 RNA polymerase sigma factor FliA [Gammaproteobacteria bacterium]